MIYLTCPVVLEKINPCKLLTELFRLLAPGAVGLYSLIIMIGKIHGALGGFFSVYVVQDLNVSDAWFGKKNFILIILND